MTDLSRMKPAFFFTSFKNFKSAISTAILLVIVSFFIIGGCNDSGFNQTQEARTIGEIQGVIVPAVRAEFFLQRWQEGDPDGNIFLNGSSVSGLNQSEQDALNNAYLSGFFVSLINPETENINDLLDVLGIQQLIEDNRPVDLYAVSREFNVSGVRHFSMDSIDDTNLVTPIELSFHRERVERLITWAANQTTATTSVREVGTEDNQLTSLADSTSHTNVFSFPSGLTVDPEPFISLSDFKGIFTVTLQGWSAHSIAQTKDFYFFLITYDFAPDTSLRSSPAQPWPCQVQQGPRDPLGGFLFDRNLSLRGVTSYVGNNIVTNFAEPVVVNLDAQPPTTEPTVTTESSVSRTISGSVSYSTEDGASASVSESVTYENSTSYSSTAITTSNLSSEGPNGNNAEWEFDVQGSNAMTTTFFPQAQWVMLAEPETRAGGF